MIESQYNGVTGVDEIGPSGRPGRRSWEVGGDRVELMPDGSGWTARVTRAAWDGAPLVLDDHFGDEAEALAWCRRMAEVFADDLEDERGGSPPRPELYLG